MKIWFDTEFIEDGKTIDLISIGMVREDAARRLHRSREDQQGIRGAPDRVVLYRNAPQ